MRSPQPLILPWRVALDEFECDYLRRLLVAAGGSFKLAAPIARINAGLLSIRFHSHGLNIASIKAEVELRKRYPLSAPLMESMGFLDKPANYARYARFADEAGYAREAEFSELVIGKNK